jgi:hypothetical protein
MKTILTGELNTEHPGWICKISNPSGLNLPDLFITCNFEIPVPQHPTHFVPDGRGDILDIVVHEDIRLSKVKFLGILDQITYLSSSASWIILRQGYFWIQLKNLQTGSGFKASPLPYYPRKSKLIHV